MERGQPKYTHSTLSHRNMYTYINVLYSYIHAWLQLHAGYISNLHPHLWGEMLANKNLNRQRSRFAESLTRRVLLLNSRQSIYLEVRVGVAVSDITSGDKVPIISPQGWQLWVDRDVLLKSPRWPYIQQHSASENHASLTQRHNRHSFKALMSVKGDLLHALLMKTGLGPLKKYCSLRLGCCRI